MTRFTQAGAVKGSKTRCNSIESNIFAAKVFLNNNDYTVEVFKHQRGKIIPVL